MVLRSPTVDLGNDSLLTDMGDEVSDGRIEEERLRYNKPNRSSCCSECNGV